MIVKLLRRYSGCNAGELAGFPDDEAQYLIENGLASLPENADPAQVAPRTQPVDPGVVVHGVDDADPEALAPERDAFGAHEKAQAMPPPAKASKPAKGRK